MTIHCIDIRNIFHASKKTDIVFSRAWAMPDKCTFLIKPIRAFIDRHLNGGIWLDPFAHFNRIASVTNDLDPNCGCDHQLDAYDFLKRFADRSVDGVLFDPPYSPRQVSECYRALGRTVNMATTQASYWSKLKVEIARIVKPGGKVLTFGWNSGGIGDKYGFDKLEVQLVAHGGWHNDTICVAEKKLAFEFRQKVPPRRGRLRRARRTADSPTTSYTKEI